MSGVLLLVIIINSVCFFISISCDSMCSQFNTCSNCIGYAYDHCVWCSAEEHKGRRCQSQQYTEKQKSWCDVPTYDPQPKTYFAQNDDFNNGQNGSKVIQLKPQQINIKTRPGVNIKIQMSYKPAKDYPLDVYYLIDYSFTMMDHAKALQRQGEEIYKKLTKLTNNVRLGIGTFVDKPALPIADLQRQKSYSFQNHLKLTNNMTLFVKALDKGPEGANYDRPEAALDALMQAMVCKHEIGWRDNARRIIVLTTDAPYHIAGDGKFVGAIAPHDMKCYLENNSYTMALKFDYPSLSQINKVATENNIKIIFAVSADVIKDYGGPVNKIQGANYALFDSESNVADMIKNEYLKLIRNIKFGHNLPEYMQLDFKPNCNVEGNCVIKHSEALNVTASLRIEKCTDKLNYIAKIGPITLDEKLTINVEVDCKCDCEEPTSSKYELDSPKCSSMGTYLCGVCKCNDNRYGEICQCNGTSTDNTDIDECKPGKNYTLVCSGRGTCKCGKCENCELGFSGEYCEFDDNACSRPGGIICAGHGRCRFGKCECDSYWIGDGCECPNDSRDCIAPSSKEICSGNGKCVCGQCKCDKNSSATNGICFGRFCDDCKFSAKRCKELEKYAYCNLNETKSYCDKQHNQKDTKVILVNRTEISAPVWYKAIWCKQSLENGSTFIFRYDYTQEVTNSLVLLIQNELEMPPLANILVAIASVVGAILLIGLLTLLAWKILIDLHDKKEYEKLCNDLSNPDYGVTCNILYREPVVNFRNPAFQQNSFNS